MTRPAKREQRRPTTVKGYLDPEYGPFCLALKKNKASVWTPEGSHMLPWITPVLGSGAVAPVIEDEGRSLSQRLDSIYECLSGAEVLDNGEDVTQLVRGFLASVSGLTVPSENPTVDRSDRLLPLVAQVILVAALLTRLYKESAVLVPEAIGRFSTGEVGVNADAQPAYDITGGLRDRTANELSKLLHDLPRDSSRDPDPVWARLKSRSQSVLSALGVRQEPRWRVVLSDVEMFTEFAWYLATKGTSTYPGWNDLMLDLSLHGEGAANDGPYPSIGNLDLAPDWISRRIQALTKCSWEARTGNHRRSLHDAIADLLVAQSRVRRLRRGSYALDDIPPAVAFVTSFDVELELALLALHEPFVMAIPFNVVDKLDDTATSIWLGCVVKGASVEQPLDALIRPGTWFEFTGDNLAFCRLESASMGDEASASSNDLASLIEEAVGGEDETQPRLGELPIVVRLNGCPVVSVPESTQALRSSRGQSAANVGELLERRKQRNGQLPTLTSAVLVDDYAALQQAAAEGPPGVNSEHALPRDLLVGTKAFPRFWAVLGVQVRDSGVRYHFASQLIRSDQMNEQAASQSTQADVRTSPEAASTTRRGLVVVRRRFAAAEELLSWMQFDVVEGDVSDMEIAFDHVTKHLSQASRAPVGKTVGGADLTISDPCEIEKRP